MVEIVTVIVLFVFSFWLGIQLYRIGRKHGIVIGRERLGEDIAMHQEQQRIHEDFIDSCKEEFGG